MRVQINPTTPAARRVRLARAALARADRFPYYAPLLFSLTLVETDAVPTAGIDAKLRLYYNPEYVQQLSDPELAGLVWHEIQHALREHVGPRGQALTAWIAQALREGLRGDASRKRLAELWAALLQARDPLGQAPPALREACYEGIAHELANIAADLEVNDDAAAAGVRLPPGGLMPEALDLKPGQTAEWYAERLLERDDGQGRGAALEALLEHAQPDLFPQGAAEALEAGHEPLRDSGVSERIVPVVLRQTAEEILRHAEQHGQGSVPAGVLRAARALLEPKADWRSLLRQKVRKAVLDLSGRVRSTYTRPHRRAPRRLVLPGRYGLRPRVAVVLDTSGSMGEAELAQALAETRSILRGRRVTYYAVDAAVHAAQRVASIEQIRLLGGGGTNMGAGIEAAVRDGADLIVVLTDGLTPWPQTPPKATVVVGLLDSGQGDPPTPPWARVVRIPVGKPA